MYFIVLLKFIIPGCEIELSVTVNYRFCLEAKNKINK